MTKTQLREAREALKDPSGDDESFWLERILDAIEAAPPEVMEALVLPEDPRS